MFLYLPIESERTSPYIGLYHAFGLQVCKVQDGVDEEITCLLDISTDDSFVLRRADIFNQKQHNPIHLPDVMEDSLYPRSSFQAHNMRVFFCCPHFFFDFPVSPLDFYSWSFRMVCRDFILPEFCKPCLLLSTFQFAKLIGPDDKVPQNSNFMV